MLRTESALAILLHEDRAGFEETRVSETAQRARIVRGGKDVLGHRGTLVRLAASTGQAGAMDDLQFFLELPQSRLKEACLVLFEEDGEGRPAAAVLLFQYKVLGVGCRVYATADTTGRRTVIAPAEQRAHFAAAAARLLLLQGAQIVLTSLQPGPARPAEAAVGGALGSLPGARWAAVSRNVPLYLPLGRSMDETLSRIGQRTRSNLRYYRRRAERDLGCSFVTDVQITPDEFLAFNRRCKYAVSDELARWRMDLCRCCRDRSCMALWTATERGWRWSAAGIMAATWRSTGRRTATTCLPTHFRR